MIAVIHLLQLVHDTSHTDPFLICKSFEKWTEVLSDFVCGKATDFGVTLVQRNILQIVQVTENADMGKFGHASEQRETDIFITRLQITVESLQQHTMAFLKPWLVNCLKERLVIFINQDYGFSA